MPSSGMCRRVVLVRSDVSDELRASKLFLRSVRRLLVMANVPSSPIPVTLMTALRYPPKRQFLQEPHDLTSQKTAFFKMKLST
jgi:hypothetical protein